MGRDFREAGLPGRQLRMLEFVEKLTSAPWLVREDDVRELRAAGFTEIEILHVVLGCAHFNYLNRMADGLGIPIDYPTPLELPGIRARIGPPGPASPLVLPGPHPGGRASWLESGGAGDEEAPGEPRNIFRAMSASPAARDTARKWRRHALRATPRLGGRLRAEIALLAAGVERCGYSVAWLRRLLEDGGAPADSPDEKTILEHAHRLAAEPWTVREHHIRALRGAGLEDPDILALTILVAYVSFEVRAALGLGVALEGDA